MHSGFRHRILFSHEACLSLVAVAAHHFIGCKDVTNEGQSACTFSNFLPFAIASDNIVHFTFKK
jgi:hypothetical protein